MSQWTPGPWLVMDKWYVVTDKDRTMVATTSGGYPKQTEANARLIAAAPEMVEYIRAFAPLGGCVYETQPGLGPKPIECCCGSCWARTLLARLEA